MSFIEEQRKNIIAENNTAQSDFLDLLDHLNPQVSDIIVREPLSGDLDFTVLKECNFTNITSLQFASGNLTSLKNIPDGITKIICQDNLLIDLVDLPASLVELNVSGNGLKHIDWSKEMNAIKEVNVSRNQFSTLSELPASLETLKCENNILKLLN
jgi:Leucine-rich repeat (LRR) protein